MDGRKRKLLRQLYYCLSLVLGNGLLAFLVAGFVIPHNIITGGATGIAIVLSRMLPVDTATVVLVFNILMLILGWGVLGRKFFLSTVASSLLYPIFLGLMQRIPGIESLTDNSLLATLFAGGLLGVALGVVLRVGASTGGIDTVTLCLNKWFHWNISLCMYLCDFVILGAQALLSQPEPILYGIAMLVLETVVLNQVMLLGTSQIQIFAISEHYDAIRRKILTELGAGATMIQMETGYLGQPRQGILCVIPRRKLHAATELIQAIDPNVFMTVTQIKEVRGQGFSRERQTPTPQTEA